MHRLRQISVAALATGILFGCGGKDDTAVQSAQLRTTDGVAAPTATPGGSGTPAVPAGRSAGGAPGGGAPGGARGGQTITLAKSDIATVRRNSIEEGIAITGDLRPIESVGVRARLEGDLVGVYVREGQQVAQGELLARFESSEQQSGTTSARADRVAAESDLATSRWNLEQTTELYKAGAVAERDLKIAQQTVTTAQARLAAAEARVRATGSSLSDTRVLSPTAGIVSARAVENGEHVARGAMMFTVVRTNVLELAAAVPARQANNVRTGQTVHFTADARAFDGKVARVSPTIDPSSRSITVYVQIPNASGALKGGTFASGRVVSRVIPNALVVPMSAIKQSQDEGRPFVYRLAGKAIDIANVQLGVVDDRVGTAEVLEGLTEGDRVIVGNVGAIGRGTQVIVAGEENGPRGQRESNGRGSRNP